VTVPTATAFVSDCPFCAIARGVDRGPEIVAQGVDWLAFFPDAPATPGHTLVIPRTHVSHLWAASPDLAAALIEGVLQVGRAVRAVVNPEGMNLISSAGSAAEQTVPHLHLHVVPRWHDDNIDEIWPPKTFTPRPLSHELGEQIRAALT
jgi:histidine triad (HIT) family protein